ncbi:MAG: glycyl-radical enzyme activating protein [Bacteroidales bacterium]|jgi:pyruvate formate lyase activating enzyme|nr:glycyl-radical enzyme activating protein [Bacteroidales bacterium]
MLGLIFDIRSFSVHDGPGIRQTVFLKGCPLRCAWCHNPESQKNETETIRKNKKIGNKVFSSVEKVGKWMGVDEVMKIVKKDIPFYEESGGGVTLSGGEPMMQGEFAGSLLNACKNENIHTTIDTCGYAEPQVLESILPFTDLFLYDLKIADEQKHTQYTGVGNQLILSNLKIISKNNKPIIIRIPLIPDITDNIANLEALRNIIESTPGIIRIDLLPYHSSAYNKYERMGRIPVYSVSENYDSQKAAEIKDFFNNSAPFISIGG